MQINSTEVLEIISTIGTKKSVALYTTDDIINSSLYQNALTIHPRENSRQTPVVLL